MSEKKLSILKQLNQLKQHPSNPKISLPTEIFPLEECSFDILFFIFFHFMDAQELLGLKRVCKKFKKVAVYVISLYKYNTQFLHRQQSLLIQKKQQIAAQLDATQMNIDFLQLEIQNMKHKRSDLRHQIESITPFERIIKENIKMGGNPDGLMMIYLPWAIQRFKKYTVDYIARKCNNDKPFEHNNDCLIMVHKNQSSETLKTIDRKFKAAGFLKYFAFQKEKQEIAFIFQLPPKEPKEPNAHFCLPINRRPFHDCPICKAVWHTMFDCPNSFCYQCKKMGHITRACPKAFCKGCRKKGHIKKFCPQLAVV